MKSTPRFVLGLAVAMMLSACAGDRDLVSHEALGIHFECSPRFIVGAYALPEMISDINMTLAKVGIDTSGTNCIALVEPAELGENKPSAIMMGEVPSISITRYTGQHADFFRRSFFKDDFKIQLGGNTAYRLPGGPGPYGEEAFYYLVPMSNGVILELSAHRHYLRRADHKQTHYDKDIEAIVASVRPAHSKDNK